jgi:hypothetical protein
MSEKQRRSVLFIALAGATAWSAWLAANEPESEADTVVEVAEPVAPNPPALLSSAQRCQCAGKTAEAPRWPFRANLFPEQTWFIPPPPPPPPPYVPPPPPQAPALPFSYMGRWQEAGQTTYYLARGALPVSVRAGQVLDGVWRLEPVSGGRLNFTHLPLNQTRSLRTGD